MPHDLAEFERQVRSRTGTSTAWPFVCDGSPYGCDVFLVGINPVANVPLWPHWSVNAGVKREAWLSAYKATHGKFTPTRLRIERLVEKMAPARALETNVFHHPSPKASDLVKEQRTREVFEFLLTELKPRVVFIHGRMAVRELERLTEASFQRGELTTARCGSVTFDVWSDRHLCRWSYSSVDSLAQRLRERS